MQAARSPADVGRQVDACEDLLAYLHDELRPRIGVPEPQPAHWGILLALFASATTTYEAVVLLAREELGYQAAMLNRSLFEVMVDCYWAAMNPTLAVERIKDHMSYNAHLKARVSAKYPDQFGGIAPPPALSDSEEKRLRKLYRGGSVSWTGLSLYDRVKAISERWPRGKAREHLMFFVDIANSINNEVLHPTPWGISRTTRPATAPDGSDAVRFHVGKSPEFCSEALFGSFWIASSVVRLILQQCGLEAEKFEDGLYTRGIRAFVAIRPEQLRKLARNEQCPCGSGLKLKRCHGQ